MDIEELKQATFRHLIEVMKVTTMIMEVSLDILKPFSNDDLLPIKKNNMIDKITFVK
jgi:hypothetical protein